MVTIWVHVSSVNCCIVAPFDSAGDLAVLVRRTLADADANVMLPKADPAAAVGSVFAAVFATTSVATRRWLLSGLTSTAVRYVAEASCANEIAHLPNTC